MATISAKPKEKAIGAKNRASTPGPAPRSTSSSNDSSSNQPLETRPKLQEPPSSSSHRQKHSSDKGFGALDEKVLRAGFLRKVYGILTAQMIITVGIAAMCMYTPAIRNTFLRIAQHECTWFKFAAFVPTVASLLILQCGAKSKYPTNYVLLAIFTLGISVDVGYICSVLHAVNYGHIVLQAFAVTAIIFTGLSVYALYSGKDFSYMGGFLTVALWGLCLSGLVGFLFPWMLGSLTLGFMGALTFCGYILFDTWRIQTKFGYDDYILATIELYLDIVNLFLYILKILMELQKDSKKKSN